MGICVEYSPKDIISMERTDIIGGLSRKGDITNRAAQYFS